MISEESCSKNLKCIGVLREIKSAWERRVPITPQGCKQLIKSGIKIIVQPSKIRCFSDDEYAEIGAEVKDDISECNVVIGIQEPDLQYLLSEKTYMFFSHTRKGQTENPTLLEKILEKKIRLIDYECIKEDKEDRTQAKRLVSFGRIAGIAGTINILKGVGELLLARQVSTPFVFTKLSYMYTDVEDAKYSLRILGKYIQDQYLPDEYCPFTIGILGNGQVSSGVQEALKCLPHKFLTPKELLEGNIEKRRDAIYVVVFNLEDIYEKTNAGPDEKFDKSDFIKSPEQYISIFNNRYLGHFQILINCLYWESRYPKIITKDELKARVTKHDFKLIGISDIACDINGAIEILKEYTSYRKPFFIYEPVLEKNIHNVDSSTKEGIIYHAIPNLAASFSIDASEYFCGLLLPYIKTLAFSSYPTKFEDQNDINNELKHACITSNGVLTPQYRNIFRNTEEGKKAQINNIKEQIEKPFFISLKMKGHLFDSGFFNILINYFPTYSLSHKINFLSIGEAADLFSILYFDAFASNKESLKNFMSIVKEQVIEYKLELDILKSNIS